MYGCLSARHLIGPIECHQPEPTECIHAAVLETHFRNIPALEAHIDDDSRYRQEYGYLKIPSEILTVTDCFDEIEDDGTLLDLRDRFIEAGYRAL